MVEGVAEFARTNAMEVLLIPFRRTSWAFGDNAGLAASLAGRLDVPSRVLTNACTPGQLAGIIGRSACCWACACAP